MRVAVVHDHFTQLGSAEKIAEELYRMIPGSDLFATVAVPDKIPEGLKGIPITTSWLQYLPGIQSLHRLYFPLYPFGVSSLDLSDYDLVLSSSSDYVKGVRVGSDAIHVCYCHAPMKWLWSYADYSQQKSFKVGIRTALPTMIRRLRAWDESASRQPDHFVASSRITADRIQKAYGRTAQVIPPPVDLFRFTPSQEQDDYYVVLARNLSSERIDLAVEACTRLGRKLLVIGSFAAEVELKRNAGTSVEFLGRISDEELKRLIPRCRALIIPGEDDIDTTPVEVAASGRPSIIFAKGGAVETVIDGKTGTFFYEQSVAALIEAIKEFESQSWSSEDIKKHAQNFSPESFQHRFMAFLQRVGAIG